MLELPANLDGSTDSDEKLVDDVAETQADAAVGSETDMTDKENESESLSMDVDGDSDNEGAVVAPNKGKRKESVGMTEPSIVGRLVLSLSNSALLSHDGLTSFTCIQTQWSQCEETQSKFRGICQYYQG